MTEEIILAALDTEFESMDIGRVTARQYLKQLLGDLLEKGESFSGKRPWGNSGWEYELAVPLILAGAISGAVDEDGYAEVADESEYRTALAAMVEAL